MSDNDRVRWDELARLIQDNLPVSHHEASNLADNALNSEWKTSYGKDAYGEGMTATERMHEHSNRTHQRSPE